MLYDIYNKDTVFLPSVHGWKYANEYGFEIALGMCYTVLDRFYNGILIPDFTVCPNSGSDEWIEIYERQVLVLNAALESEIYSWTTLKTDQERLQETWNLLDTLDNIDTPVILIVVNELTSDLDQAVFPVILHHVDFYSTDLCRLFVYDPFEALNFTPSPEESADNTIIQLNRAVESNGTIGMNSRTGIYGAFQWQYDRPITSQCMTSSISMTGVSSATHTNSNTDITHRLDTVRISVNWDGNVIPYHSLKVDNNHAWLSDADWSFSSLDDIKLLYGTDTYSPYNQSDTRLRYLLNSASGEKCFDAKFRVDTETYAKRKIRIDFPDEILRLDYLPDQPELIKTFFTVWPYYFDLGYADSDKVHGLTSDQVTIREDYDESVHGVIPPEQSVYVKGSKGLQPWDTDASLAVNLFGAGLAYGFIKEKISCVKKTLRFFGRQESLNTSFWIHSSPDSPPSMLVEKHRDVTGSESFCLNDILAGDNADSRIRDGFTNEDFDQNSYIDVHFECEDEAGQHVEKETRLWARNRLIFTGVEPPNLKYVRIDLKAWILGPYLRQSIIMLDLIDIRRRMIRGAASHREAVEKAINGVLDNFDRIENNDREIINKTIAGHREMMIRDYKSLLLQNRGIKEKALDVELKAIRESRYRMLMNSLSQIVLGIVQRGRKDSL
jgi:hypothetical protein